MKIEITAEELEMLKAVAARNECSIQAVAKAPTTPKESVRPVIKMTKADRKVKNQKLMRSINGKLAAATKATDKAKALVFLKDAQALTPVNWSGVQAQIERKYVALGLGN
tara:strand:- start:1574 stop:1903 length:330 start_codon:yes stop_codon:yes gene_type:complete